MNGQLSSRARYAYVTDRPNGASARIYGVSVWARIWLWMRLVTGLKYPFMSDLRQFNFRGISPFAWQIRVSSRRKILKWVASSRWSSCLCGNRTKWRPGRHTLNFYFESKSGRKSEFSVTWIKMPWGLNSRKSKKIFQARDLPLSQAILY